MQLIRAWYKGVTLEVHRAPMVRADGETTDYRYEVLAGGAARGSFRTQEEALVRCEEIADEIDRRPK